MPSTADINFERILAQPIASAVISSITGDAPRELKEMAIRWYMILSQLGGYVRPVREKLQITDVSLLPVSGEQRDAQVKLTCEVDVLPEMCSSEGVMDHGCTSFLIDEGSSIALQLLNIRQGLPPLVMGVSQSLNITFHTEAPQGSRIRIISSSVTKGRETGYCTSEAWDVKNSGACRLLASATHLVLPASIPKERISRL